MRVRFTVTAHRVSHTGGPLIRAMGYVLAPLCGSEYRRRPRLASTGWRSCQRSWPSSRPEASTCSSRAAPAPTRCSATPPSPTAGAQITEDAAEVWRSDVVVTIAPPDPQAIRGLGAGSILIGFLAPLTSPQTTRALAEAKGDGLRDGGDSPHLARPVDGRAVLAEQRRRLPRGAARRRGDGPLLPDADDRRGHDPAGEGARPRRRRGRPAGARDRQAPRRAHDRLRRAPGGRRAGAIARRASGSTSGWRRAARAATRASSPTRSAPASSRR